MNFFGLSSKNPRSPARNGLIVILLPVILLLSHAGVDAQCHVMQNCVDCALVQWCGWCYGADGTGGSCLEVSNQTETGKLNGTMNHCPNVWAYYSYKCNCSFWNHDCTLCAQNGCGMCNRNGTMECISPFREDHGMVYPPKHQPNCSDSSYEICAAPVYRVFEVIFATFTVAASLILLVSCAVFHRILRNTPCNWLFLLMTFLEFIGGVMRWFRFLAETQNYFDGANPASTARRPLEMGYLYVTLLGQAVLGLKYLSFAVNYRYGTHKAKFVFWIGSPLVVLATLPSFVLFLKRRNYYDYHADEILFGLTLSFPSIVGLLALLYVLGGIRYMWDKRKREVKQILQRFCYALVLVVYQSVLLSVVFERNKNAEVALLQTGVVGAAAIGAIEVFLFIWIENIHVRWRIRLFGLPQDRYLLFKEAYECGTGEMGFQQELQTSQGKQHRSSLGTDERTELLADGGALNAVNQESSSRERILLDAGVTPTNGRSLTPPYRPSSRSMKLEEFVREERRDPFVGPSICTILASIGRGDTPHGDPEGGGLDDSDYLLERARFESGFRLSRSYSGLTPKAGMAGKGGSHRSPNRPSILEGKR